MSPTPEEIQKAHQVLFDQGMEVRKAVVGPEHVERSMAGVSDFAMPIQHIVTEACWGAIWTRPGLERKTRSMLNIAMLSALNRYPFVCFGFVSELLLLLSGCGIQFGFSLSLLDFV
jgi:alkylhydroperoxidase/carboxymuconolactone decarboxylase family protein YurZ